MAAQEELIKSLKKNYDRKLFAVEVLSPVFGSLLEVYSILQKPAEQPNNTESKVIEEVGIYGRVNLEDDVEVLCYEIHLKDHVRIDQSKVAIQHYVRKLLTSGQAALINFVSPTYTDMWRFTLVTKDSELTSKGIQEKATHPKRYTFLVESGRNNKTFAERMEWLSLESDTTMESLVEAFSVEKMSNAFFEEYKEHYQNFVQYLTGKRMVKKGSKWQEEKIGQPSAFLKSIFNGNEKDARDFCKKLLGRIVFLYFVQKKRWLGASDTEYEDGSQNFVFEIFEETGGDERFFPHGLTELFFNALNKERPDDLYETPGGREVRIPYLNGGLFTRDQVDELLHKKGDIMTFPYKLFSNEEKREDPLPKNASVETDDTYEYRGFLDFLNAFNFTVYEDSQDDHTVAVDPEMLGHIFENLLEDNKDKGAYYTPKEIVNYMCQESLLEYLKTHLGDKTNKEELGKLVREKEPNHLSEDVLQAVNEKLDEVKICDPAIGSGAFPMGLLQEIFSIKEIIAYEIDLDWDPAKTKEDIIQNSIYGVDIEKGAVDIARLRFWLSLVVDKDKPKALPNLDYKIVVGDSLVPKFEEEIIHIEWDVKKFTSSDEADRKKTQNLSARIATEQKKFFDPNLQDKKKVIADIRNMKLDLLETQLTVDHRRRLGNFPEHLDSGLGLSPKQVKENQRRDEFINQYNRLVRKISQLRKKHDAPFNHFDWRLDFPAILNPLVADDKETGFDIVIGNPPYIQLQKMGATADILKDQSYETYARTGDIYCLFYEKGMDVLCDGGVLSYITSNSWLQAGYGKSLRKYFAERTNPISLINFEDTLLFDTAIVEANILNVCKEPFSKSLQALRVDEKFNPGLELHEAMSKKGVILADLPLEGWSVSDAETIRLKLLMEANGKRLEDWKVVINRGVTTGYNEAFVIDGETRLELTAVDPENEKLIKPTLRGRDLKRYSYEFADWWLITTFPSLKIDIDQYPKLKDYFLSIGKERLEQSGKSGSRKKTNNDWFEAQDSISYWRDFEKPKIIWGELSNEAKFTFDHSKHYLNNTIFMMVGEKLKYLLGVMNSKAAQWYFEKISTTSGMGTNRWLKYKIINLVVPNPSIKQEKVVDTLVDYVLFINSLRANDIKVKLYAAYFEQIIDGIVYELYFPELLKKHDRQIIQHLGELPALKASMSDQEKLAICKKVFERLDDKEHPIRNNIFYMDSIPEIGIIEGKGEDH